MMYNAEIRGLLGYYALADNLVEVADKVLWLTTSSFFRTLAGKRQSSVKKVAKSLKRGPGRYIMTLQKEGKPTKEYELVSSTRQLQRGGSMSRQLDLKPSTWMYRNRTEVGKRLLAHQCEWCGTRQGQIEVHHIRKLGNLKGKVSWERQMIQRNRKTMILCAECHDELHAGTLSEKKKRRANGRAVYPKRGMGGSEGSSVKPDVAIR
jgi:AI2M/AI1M-like HNH endonuclease/type II intron maturase